MTTLDQRILIPATAEQVWAYISDLANNPLWQVDCAKVAFLTSRRDQAGLRWRSANQSGHETVMEITTWYDRLGYEYTYIDGVPFRESRGRFRLQEIPEGTIVQWSLSYELGGIMAGVRNALSVRRQYERIMIDSLRALWREIARSGSSEPGIQAKSLMRDAPDVEARSQYQPRHPSAIQRPVAPPETPVIGQPPVVISEPPISDEDTRPRPAVAAVEVLPEPSPEPSPKPTPKPMDEPDFLVGMTSFEAAKAPEVETPEAPSAAGHDEMFRRPTMLEPKALDRDAEPVSVPDVPQRPQFLPETADIALNRGDEPVPSIDSTKLDTAQMSVFDVFGLPKPSETQEIEAVKSLRSTEVDPTSPRRVVKEEPITAETKTATSESARTVLERVQQRRVGLRMAIRRNMTRLRQS